jgi:hypothetical protein
MFKSVLMNMGVDIQSVLTLYVRHIPIMVECLLSLTLLAGARRLQL